MTRVFIDEEQLVVSTAEEERNYFTDRQSALVPGPIQSPLPEGSYRVLNGELYRLVPGQPQLTKPTDTSSSGE